MPVDPGTALALKNDASYLRQPSAAAMMWGERGAESKSVSPLIERAAAIVEAGRQIEFLAAPLVQDVLRVSGSLRSVLGRTVRIVADQLGYEAGATVFVIGVRELETESELTVLRRLGDA